jgi:crotonobetainyl-CoA:carnitine CoA-transferase CaiB-like acyl-CoA transferase
MSPIFKGLRIIDLTHAYSGPFAARMFADYGAEVLKIEHESHPDDARAYPPLNPETTWSGYYALLNRNKYGIALDLKNPLHLAHFYKLCSTADVLVENFSPEVKQRLKIDYPTASAFQPRLIYASLSGIGQDSSRKYYDILAQAESGLLSLTGLPHLPMKIGPSVVDAFSGLMLAFGIAAALLHRERTGCGQYLDVSMLGAALHLLESNLVAASLTHQNPQRTGNQDNLIAPFGIFQTADGHIALAAGNETQWERLVVFLQARASFDAAQFGSNALRLEHSEALTRVVETCFRNFSRSELLLLLTELDIPCAPVNTMLDVLQMDSLYERGELITTHDPQLGSVVMPGYPIRFQQTAAPCFSPAPKIGQDNVRYRLPD